MALQCGVSGLYLTAAEAASSEGRKLLISSISPPQCRCVETVRFDAVAQLRSISVARSRDVRRGAGFQPFGTGSEVKEEVDGRGQEEMQDEETFEDTRDDSVLPNSLEDAVVQSAQAAALYITSGGARAVTELLLPELENLNEEGAQEKLWSLSRLFIETLQEVLGIQRVKAIFPDAGAAALVKFRWGDVKFSFASLNDRRPVSNDDELIVLVAPDYQLLADVQNVASLLAGDGDRPARPLVMWNPRLVSGDVGVGLNVRRMREYFLSTFTPVYSMRPLPFGAIFRKYPGLWQVFLDDKGTPGRYVLAKETVGRPNPDDLDVLFLSGGAENEQEQEASPLIKVMGVIASFNRFFKSLSN